MRILMIRHGRTAWNAEGRVQGRSDLPLSESGRREQAARSVPDEFRDSPCHVSPLKRARETAALLGRPDAEVQPALIEMDFGEWEGRTHAELHAADPEGLARAEAKGLDMRPPGGETPREVQARLTRFLAGLDGERAVLITHKGVMRAALSLAWNWDMTCDPPRRIDWSAGQEFDWTAGVLRPAVINRRLAT